MKFFFGSARIGYGVLAVVVVMVGSGIAAAAAEWGAADGFFDVRAFGATGDGATDDSGAFLAALEEAGEGPATLLVTRGRFLVGDLVLPEGITLSFRGGGKLVVAEGARFEINGTIEAGIVTVFGGEGTVTGAVKNRYVYPQWFGARGDGIHDDGPAIQRAADLAATAMGRTLFLPEGDYLFRSDIEFRSHVESRGRLIKEMRVDEERTRFSYSLYLPTHYPVRNPEIRFMSDHPEVELVVDSFLGIEEGDMAVPVYRKVPLADGSGTVDLAEGGTLRFFSTDFFKSRQVRQGDHWYDRNDIVQLVSGRGDVFPEFAFDYAEPPAAAAWSPEETYGKGAYVTHAGAAFKATFASGPETRHRHPHLGWTDIGAVEPQARSATTVTPLRYEEGVEDEMRVWRLVETRVWYRPEDVPLTVNALRIEVRLEGHDGRTKRLAAGAMVVNRSNMTFNNLHVSVRDREATMARLLQSRDAVNLEFNNSYFSGATSAHLGYNILNTNVANVRFNHCVSTNSRKGMDGRHAKNVWIVGGYYNVIEDHYGRNFTVRDAVLSGQSVRVPGDSTPEADLDAWHFVQRRPLGFAGKNMHIENCVIDGAAGGIFVARSDVGDLYGRIVLRDITVRRNQGDVRVFSHLIAPGFDYVYPVRVPAQVLIENVRLEEPGRLMFPAIGTGFAGGSYGPVYVRNSGPIGEVRSTSESVTFMDCTFEDARFDLAPGAKVNLVGNRFLGGTSGLDVEGIGYARGNLVEGDGAKIEDSK